MLCEPPALDSGQPLADGIHLHDIGSAGKELICNVLQFSAGDKRLFKQGAAAAGKQKQHRVLCGQPLYQRQSFFGGCKAVGIRYGMTCLITIYTRDSAFYMAICGCQVRNKNFCKKSPTRLSIGSYTNLSLVGLIFLFIIRVLT